MIPFRRAAVIGLGLVGGSLARELAAAGVQVSAFDANEEDLRAARAEGIVRAALPASFEGVEGAELIALGVPVDATAEVLSRLAPRARAARLIVDVGSTKATVVAAASRLGLGERFVGAHPMAGDHRSGWAASRPGLFTGASVYVCPCPETRAEALALAIELWNAVGAAVVRVDAVDHDRRLAWTSHMPHMTSIALASVFSDAGIAREELGPGGRDVTRLAGSSVSMWTAVARENPEPIAEALHELECRIGALRAAIQSGDADALASILSRARGWFDAAGAAASTTRT